MTLLAASLFFYYYGEKTLVLLLVFSIAANYTIGKYLENIPPKQCFQRNLTLFLGLAINLGLLSYYKYANFFVLDILTVDASTWSKIALPLGISFYSFQCMSYLVDIYNGKIKSPAGLVSFGAYVSCFPQLIAGPIVRYEEVARALAARHISFEDIFEGCRRFCIGLGKKMLIANPMGYVADKIYSMPPECLDAPHAWIAILCYTLQIYYDFSGYSDMAIGLGRFFGFRFPENFNYPYAASSIKNFWRRWHMTLTSWFRDYVYIPLGGNRVSPLRVVANKWIVFALCGLWHGASWNFIVWGLYHGFFLVAEDIAAKKSKIGITGYVKYVYVILVVALGWVVFRAETMSYAIAMYKAAFGLGLAEPYPLSISRFWRADIILPLVLGIIGSFPVLACIEKIIADRFGAAVKDALRYFLLLAIFVIASAFSFSTAFNPFLYFRF